jgi:hypothetical protein
MTGTQFRFACCALAASVVLGTASEGSAATLAVNFSGRLDGSNTVADTLLVEAGTSSTGAAGVNGTTEWNDIIATGGPASGTDIPVAGTEGVSATVSWTATGTWAAGAQDGVGNRQVAAEDPSGDMKDGHIEGNAPMGVVADGISITVNGLEEFVGPYNVYLYTGHDATGERSGEFSINGGAAIPYTTAVFNGTFTEGRDYIVFSGVTGSSFTINGGGLDQANRSGVHGFEVVGRVPEPASAVLLASMMAMATLCVRRRS